jgi:hypothetical protein
MTLRYAAEFQNIFETKFYSELGSETEFLKKVGVVV